MPSLFKPYIRIPVSLPRHNDFIHAYAIRRIQNEELSWKDNLNEWFLINHGRNLIIEFEFVHKVLAKTTIRYLPISQLDLVFYIDHWCLEHLPTGRILSFKSEFLIKNVQSIDEYPETFQVLLNDKRMESSKLLKTNIAFWEDKYGQVFPLEVLE
jgi:hypothetical protein